MLGYSSFFDINEFKDDFLRHKLEKQPMKVYFDLKSNRFVCHDVVHQKQTKQPPRLIDELYRAACCEYDTQHGKVNTSKSERQARYDGIKDILKRSILRNKEFDANLLRMIDEECLTFYVDGKKNEEMHAEHARKKRFMRKCGLNRKKLNYWFTVTCDSTKFASSEDWLNTLTRWFGNNAFRYGIKVLGGIEFGEENGRIHFHGVGYFPSDFFGEDLHKVNRYSKKEKCWRTVLESNELREKFGINEFESLQGMNEKEFMQVLHYVSDYATKQGGKMYYSRGLPDCAYQYVSADDLIFEFEDGQMKYYPKAGFKLGDNSIHAMLRHGHLRRMYGAVESTEPLPFA